jgi:phage-related protein
MHIIRLYSGRAFDLYAIELSNKCQVREYLSNLDKRNETQIFSLFNSILENGPPSNERKFNHIGDGIYELKTRLGVRILSFFGDSRLPRSLILTHGFPKPKPRQLENEKTKALKWRKEYLKTADIKKIISLEAKP